MTSQNRTGTVLQMIHGGYYPNKMNCKVKVTSVEGLPVQKNKLEVPFPGACVIILFQSQSNYSVLPSAHQGFIVPCFMMRNPPDLPFLAYWIGAILL